ncbi:MAG: hydrolase [Solirubrobacterales bacterium]|nr:hydrolase [Solirubrobacterales bacterium]
MDLNHRRLGSGEPLLLLHGIGMRWQWWTPVLDALAARHEVWAIDSPGFGDSPRFEDRVNPDPAAHADAIEAFARTHGLERPAVAGISMGGWVALELAKRESVRAAIPCSPAGFWEGWEGAYGRGSLVATYGVARALAPVSDTVAAMTPARIALLSQTCAHPSRVPASEAAASLRAVAASDFPRTLKALTAGRFSDGDAVSVPVTLAWGTKDRLLLTKRQAPRAEREVRGARLVLMPGCGHIATYDDPGLMARVVLEGAAA